VGAAWAEVERVARAKRAHIASLLAVSAWWQGGLQAEPPCALAGALMRRKLLRHEGNVVRVSAEQEQHEEQGVRAMRVCVRPEQHGEQGWRTHDLGGAARHS